MVLTLSCSAADRSLVGSVSNLRILETVGRRVRLAWLGVPGATEYKIVVRNSQGESASQEQGELELPVGPELAPPSAPQASPLSPEA